MEQEGKRTKGESRLGISKKDFQIQVIYPHDCGEQSQVFSLVISKKHPNLQEFILDNLLFCQSNTARYHFCYFLDGPTKNRSKGNTQNPAREASFHSTRYTSKPWLSVLGFHVYPQPV